MIGQHKINRFAFIDALRGIAALYVFLYHLALLPNPDLGVPIWARQVVLAGGTGVTLFFVVSAFTLCTSSYARKDEINPIYRFYIRRIFRIVPLFYAWILITLLRDFYVFNATRSVKDILLSAFFVFNLVPGKEEGFVWASWTLGVEMLFYLVFPLIIRLVPNYRSALVFFMITVLTSRIFKSIVLNSKIPEQQRDRFFQFSILHFLPSFVVGILAYYLYDYFIKDQKVHKIWGIVSVGCSAFLYAALLNQKLPQVLDGIYWQAIVYGFLLIGLSIFPWEIMVNKFMVFVGTISYSVYLSHTSVIVALRPVYSYLYSLELPATFQFALSALILLIPIVGVSYISYWLIEKPGIRLGQWLLMKHFISAEKT